MNSPSKLTAFVSAVAAIARPAKPAKPVETPASVRMRREIARRLDDLPAHRRGHVQQATGLSGGVIFAVCNGDFDKVPYEAFAALCPFVFEGAVLRPDWTLGPGDGVAGNLNVAEPPKPAGPTRAERALALRNEARSIRSAARAEHGARIKSKTYANDIADADFAAAMRRADALDERATAIMREATS